MILHFLLNTTKNGLVSWYVLYMYVYEIHWEEIIIFFCAFISNEDESVWYTFCSFGFYVIFSCTFHNCQVYLFHLHIFMYIF